MWNVLVYEPGADEPAHVFKIKTKPQALALAVGFLDQDADELERSFLVQLAFVPKVKK